MHPSPHPMPRTLTFNPSPSLAAAVLDDLADPSIALDEIAANVNTTLEALASWLALPDIQQKLAALLRAAATRAQLVASLSLPCAVHALTLMLQAHADDEPAARALPAAPHAGSLAEATHAHREPRRVNTRRAADLLLRIARCQFALPPHSPAGRVAAPRRGEGSVSYPSSNSPAPSVSAPPADFNTPPPISAPSSHDSPPLAPCADPPHLSIITANGRNPHIPPPRPPPPPPEFHRLSLPSVMDVSQRIAQFEAMVRPEADPNNDMAWFSLAGAYAQAGRHADAAKAYLRCTQLNPDMSKAYQLAAASLIADGDTSRAGEVLTRGYEVAAHRGDFMPKKAMGDMLEKLGLPVPQVASAAPAAPAGSFICKRTGRPGTKMPRPPFSGPVGKWIADNISQETFKDWIAQGTKVINELRLDLSREQDADTYDQHMREFLGIDEALYADLTARP